MSKYHSSTENTFKQSELGTSLSRFTILLCRRELKDESRGTQGPRRRPVRPNLILGQSGSIPTWIQDFNFLASELWSSSLHIQYTHKYIHTYTDRLHTNTYIHTLYFTAYTNEMEVKEGTHYNRKHVQETERMRGWGESWGRRGILWVSKCVGGAQKVGVNDQHLSTHHNTRHSTLRPRI